MTKVHPQLISSTSSKPEAFTIWMKSLVLGGKGCTVFDSNGQIVYRVDNYNKKCSHEAHLMDRRGKILFTILRKKFKLLGCWEGYRSTGPDVTTGKPGFQVRKPFRILRGASPCEVVVGLDEDQQHEYKMESRSSKNSFLKIVDSFGGLVAEVKRKISTGGVVLGDDVWTMVVQANIDHSLVMGLVVVDSLIRHKI